MFFRSSLDMKVKLSLELGHRLIQKRPDDRFVVSYPRSGSTWLRTIITNVVDPTANSNPDVFNALIPGVTIRNVPIINALPSPRIIKSHTWFRPGLDRVVYILRDGRDALVSYYHYNHHSDKIGFSEFFERYALGEYGDFWHTNVLSWLIQGQQHLGQNLLIVHFEDVKTDELAQVRKILQFLNIACEPEQMETAIRLARLENMRAIEARMKGTPSNPNAAFYRSGASRQWQEYFTRQNLEVFHSISAEAMEKAGYAF